FAPLSVVINEIAWAGTNANSDDEWIELYNPTSQDIDLSGWILSDEKSQSGANQGKSQLELEFSEAELYGGNKMIKAGGYYLIERTSDNTILDITADFVSSFSGGLNNSGEKLTLTDPAGNVIDEVDCLTPKKWFAGENKNKNGDNGESQKISMERKSPAHSGSESDNWGTNQPSGRIGKDSSGKSILGTPKMKNSVSISADEFQLFTISGYTFNRYIWGRLESVVHNGKIYTAWIEVEQKYPNQFFYLSLGSCNLDGSGFKRVILPTANLLSKANIEFLIYGNSAFFSWVEWAGIDYPFGYKQFFAKADLSILDEGNSENEALYQEIQVVDPQNPEMEIFGNSVLNLDIYNSKIILSGIKDDGKIFRAEADPATLSLQNFTEFEARLTSAFVDSAIIGDKQYFSWGRNTADNQHWRSLRWGILDLTAQSWQDPGAWQDFVLEDEVIGDSKIAVVENSPYIFWGNEKNSMGVSIEMNRDIKFMPIGANQNPRLLISDFEGKQIVDVHSFNGDAYVLVQEVDVVETVHESHLRYVKLVLMKLGSSNRLDEKFTYFADGTVYGSAMVISPAGQPIFLWIEGYGSGKDLHFMRISD
ncbi:MAG: lamin tail domain-containing protein, partial [bacterium]